MAKFLSLNICSAKSISFLFRWKKEFKKNQLWLFSAAFLGSAIPLVSTVSNLALIMLCRCNQKSIITRIVGIWKIGFLISCNDSFEMHSFLRVILGTSYACKYKITRFCYTLEWDSGAATDFSGALDELRSPLLQILLLGSGQKSVLFRWQFFKPLICMC